MKSIKVDGGASANNLLMQFQADITGTNVERPSVIETTGLGAAYLAGLATGYWSGKEDIKANRSVDRTFKPAMDEAEVNDKIKGWQRAIRCALAYTD
jgi:glycerol kinase